MLLKTLKTCSAPLQSSSVAPATTMQGNGSSGGGGGRQRRRQHLRKRKKDSDDEGDGPQGTGEAATLAASAAPAEKRAGKKAGLSFGTAEGKPAAALGPVTYKGSGTKQEKSDMGATRERLQDTEIDRDGRAIREKRLKTSDDAAAAGSGQEGSADPTAATATYKGLLCYTDYRSGFRREQNASNMKTTGAFGPLRASTAIRSTFRMDYQPDICKDWKETGYCGYGDSCKFLHDRGDYKSGWQLDREWEAKEKLRQEQKAVRAFLGEDGSGSEGEGAGAKEDGKGTTKKNKDDDGLPFACHICRLPFENPVVTKCKHYFCEHCALKENAKTGKCPICKKDMNGTFNVATALAKKMKEREREKKARS